MANFIVETLLQESNSLPSGKSSSECTSSDASIVAGERAIACCHAQNRSEKTQGHFRTNSYQLSGSASFLPVNRVVAPDKDGWALAAIRSFFSVSNLTNVINQDQKIWSEEVRIGKADCWRSAPRISVTGSQIGSTKLTSSRIDRY